MSLGVTVEMRIVVRASSLTRIFKTIPNSKPYFGCLFVCLRFAKKVIDIVLHFEVFCRSFVRGLLMRPQK